MRKFLFLILLLIPLMVKAESCDQSSISIISMEQETIEGSTEVLAEPEFDGRNLSLNLKMYGVNDSISYKMTIKNDSDEDFIINQDSFKTNSNYIQYSLSSDDNTNVVKANSTKGLVLSATYISEVKDSDYTDGVYNASNKLTFELNTEGNVQEMGIITTDNKVNNPDTNSFNLTSFVIVIITGTLLTYLIIKKNNNKILRVLLFILMTTSTISVVYAICKTEVEVESHIEIERDQTIYEKMVNLSKNGESCIIKYEGPVTDKVGQTVTATNVYFNNCEEKNLIFAGYCWQVVRTTETKGIKLVYNGEPIDGKCESTRGTHKGVVGIQRPSGASSDSINIASEYKYGSTFTYDLTSATFTLDNIETATWSNETYESLIGKYTCKSNSDTCTTIYRVHSYASNTNAYLSSYKIDETNYSQIGSSAYNTQYYSPAMSGYMFNGIIGYRFKSMGSSDVYLYGSSVTYDENTNTYTLSGETQTIDTWTYNYPKTKTTHYTCFSDSNTCLNMAFIVTTAYDRALYYELKNGMNINDTLVTMLTADNVNKYNSDVKAYLESWYKNNFREYSSFLDDVVYCNNRSIGRLGGWGLDGDTKDSSSFLGFTSGIDNRPLNCQNITDQFAVSNNKAKSQYPVGLITYDEWRYIGKESEPNENISTGSDHWSITPGSFSNNPSASMGIRFVYGDGNLLYHGNSFTVRGVRPAITLKDGQIIDEGSGTETDPWIIVLKD